MVGLAPHEAEFSRWFGKMDDSVYCTWCTFQGFSFSDKLYHWRNRLGVEIGMGVFFGAMTDTSRKVKDVSVICCRLHWEWSCGHFPTGRDSHGQTWLSGLPPASLSSTYQPFPFFLKYIFYTLPFTVFLVGCCWCLWLISTKKVDGGCPWVIINEAEHFVWWTFIVKK